MAGDSTSAADLWLTSNGSLPQLIAVCRKYLPIGCFIHPVDAKVAAKVSSVFMFICKSMYFHIVENVEDSIIIFVVI